jgi:hypothetical protein
MIEIGGGSTVIVIGQGGEAGIPECLQWRRAAGPQPARSGRLRRRTRRGARKGDSAARKGKDTGPAPPESWTGVAAVYPSAALTQDIHWNDRQRIHGYAVSRGQIAQIMEGWRPCL